MTGHSGLRQGKKRKQKGKRFPHNKTFSRTNPGKYGGEQKGQMLARSAQRLSLLCFLRRAQRGGRGQSLRPQKMWWCDGGSKGDRHLREVRCACPPLVPFLVTFCGTTKSNCPRGMSASCKKKKSPIPRTKPGHRRMNCGTTKRIVRRLRRERKL